MAKRTKSQELIEFEIAFYEKLVAVYPDFVDALLPLGEAYTRRGLYEKGLEVDKRLTALRSSDPLVWYNLACSYSLLNRIEESAESLQRAFEVGYQDVGYLRNDPDLVNLRRSPQYVRLLESLSQPRKAA